MPESITMPVRSAVPLLIARMNVTRAERGMPPLKQTEIAASAGVSQSVISTLSSGKSKRIDFETIDRLCGFFGCTPGDLFIREPDPEPDSGDQ